MDNYNKISLAYIDQKFDITYEEYVMYMASPEKNWKCIEFRRDGYLHRLDGPAVNHANGDKFWYAFGRFHRSNGPAIEYADGSRSWWVDGKRHRLDGFAREYMNGIKEWYVDGEYYNTEHGYLDAVKRYKNEE